MDYVQITDSQRLAMLQAIGVDCVEDLYANLPQSYRLQEPLQEGGTLADCRVSETDFPIVSRNPTRGETRHDCSQKQVRATTP